jgi:DNA invertase Pin-like site-specific DNA recombinase
VHQKNSLDLKSLFCCINPVHNEPMIYGYARVSTDGQSGDAQVKQLRAAGAEENFRETASGARSDRAGLRRALAELGRGGTFGLAARGTDRVWRGETAEHSFPEQIRRSRVHFVKNLE